MILGECTEFDCKNGGQCDSQHKCACKEGFTGNFCEGKCFLYVNWNL